MSYKRIGAYTGEKSVKYLAEVASRLEMQASATGYEATSDQTELLRDSFYPFVGHLFPGPWKFAMVVLVKTHGHLPVHRDGAMPTGVTRYHLVLQTNPRCWYFHDGAWEQLEVGGIYELDPTLEHGAINWGAEPRIHLVIDTEQRNG